jgi:hypothetical protein
MQHLFVYSRANRRSKVSKDLPVQRGRLRNRHRGTLRGRCRDRHRDGCRVRVRGGGRGRGWRRGRLAGKVGLRDFTSSEVSKPMEHLCCAVPVSWRDIDASRFWSLQTRLNGDSEVSCAPESYPLVDVGLQFFAVDDGVEYPPADDKPFPDDLPRPQAMRGPTWVVREKCRARCVHVRIVDPDHCHCMRPGRWWFGWACPSASRRRGSPFTVCSVSFKSRY